MPFLDGNIFRKRLLSGLLFYETQVSNGGRVLNPARRDDINILTRLVQSTIDDSLLEYEINRYLSSMKSSRQYWGFFQSIHAYSYLREIVQQIIQDENRKYNLYVLWMTEDRQYRHSDPTEQQGGRPFNTITDGQ